MKPTYVLQKFIRLTGITLILGASTMAHSIEEPKYEVLENYGRIEIRQYEPVIQAVTDIKNNNHSSEGFKRLAGFIFGGNDKSQSISMTAPVQESIGVDSPQMAFTMPSEFTLDSLPNPVDKRVSLNKIPARTVAVIRFSGWANAGKVKRHTRILEDGLAKAGIDVVGTTTLNQYNPPWTLPMLRRNEIMLEINWAPSLASNELLLH